MEREEGRKGGIEGRLRRREDGGVGVIDEGRKREDEK